MRRFVGFFAVIGVIAASGSSVSLDLRSWWREEQLGSVADSIVLTADLTGGH